MSGSGIWRKEGWWWDCQKVRENRKDKEKKVIRVRVNKVE